MKTINLGEPCSAVCDECGVSIPAGYMAVYDDVAARPALWHIDCQLRVMARHLSVGMKNAEVQVRDHI